MRKKQPSHQPLSGGECAQVVMLLNEVSAISRRVASGFQDLYLHYREGEGWRAKWAVSPAATSGWTAVDGPWTGLIESLDAEMKPLRAQLTQNAARKWRRRRR